MIAYAEGTLGVSNNGYDVTFNYYRIQDWNINYEGNHEDWHIKTASLNSTAAGRYQFLFGTWCEVSKKVLNEDNAKFNKENQDTFALFKVKQRMNDNNYFDKHKIRIPKSPPIESLSLNNFHLFLDSISPEWASIPLSLIGGRGFYDKQDGKHTVASLYKIYKTALEKYQE